MRAYAAVRIRGVCSCPVDAVGPAAGQEIAVFTSSTIFFSTLGLHFVSAYDTGHMSTSSRFAASWKPKVE